MLTETSSIQKIKMMSFGNFLHQFDPDTRKSIRLIESTDRKTINAELSLLFNETCLNEKILPRYTNIYIYIYYIYIYLKSGFFSHIYKLSSPNFRTFFLLEL